LLHAQRLQAAAAGGTAAEPEATDEPDEPAEAGSTLTPEPETAPEPEPAASDE
jgi:hypothetical protein